MYVYLIVLYWVFLNETKLFEKLTQSHKFSWILPLTLFFEFSEERMIDYIDHLVQIAKCIDLLHFNLNFDPFLQVRVMF